MFVQSRTGFLEQGLLVRETRRTRELYMKSWKFRFDIISVIPIDGLLSLIMRSPQPVFRLNRLIRMDRISEFIEHTETRSAFPNVFRVLCVVIYILVIIHWNACFYFLISELIGIGKDTWVYGENNPQALPKYALLSIVSIYHLFAEVSISAIHSHVAISTVSTGRHSH